jgi:hypothetical protein
MTTTDGQSLYVLPNDGSRRDDLLVVSTPEERFAFAVQAPLQTIAAAATDRFRIRLAVRALSGTIGVGVLVKDRSKFYSHEMVSQTDCEQFEFIEVITPDYIDCGSLVIYNASAEGASCGEIRIESISKMAPLSVGATTDGLRTVHLIGHLMDQVAIMQELYLDKLTGRLRPNLTLVLSDGAVYFETNEIGLKGDPIDPSRRQAVVWGDSVVFGIDRGWPCLIDDLLPGYQFLNGGIEGDIYSNVLERAVELNRQRDISINILLLGWHPHGHNEHVRSDLLAALDYINEPMLATMPTPLNNHILDKDLSEYFVLGDANSLFRFYGSYKYSLDFQREIYRYITERNAIIREVALEKEVPLIDLFATFATDNLADFRQDFFDMMHPRPVAYEKWARAIYEGIKGLRSAGSASSP